MNYLKAYLIPLSLYVLLSLSACQKTSTPPEDKSHGEAVRVVTASVQNYSQSDADLFWDAFVFGGEPIGKIRADGDFEIDLPGSVSEEFLSPLSESFAISDTCAPNISENASHAIFQFAPVVNDGVVLGGLYQLSRLALVPDQGVPVVELGDSIVFRFYVNADARVTGSCVGDIADEGKVTTFDLSLDFKEGWNLVVVAMAQVDAEGFPTRITYKVQNAPANAKWFFRASAELE